MRTFEPLFCTLWDLACAVTEEAEKVFREEACIEEASNLVLARLIRTYGRNVEVLGDLGLPDRRGSHGVP